MKQFFYRLPLALLGWVVFSPAQGQAPAPASSAATSTATISGTVQSEKGNLVVGTTVAVLHLPTGIRRQATSDLTGSFSLNLLLTGGPYAVQVSQEGYRSQVINNVFLSANQPLTLNLTLAPDRVATGTRRTDRNAQSAAVAVDVIDMRTQALAYPRTDNTQLLNYVVPSFNSNRETSADGTDHVDGFSLRGLGVDQTLVLVNGHRRHSSPLINLLGSRGLGSSPTDLNTISANALDQVQVLRDGAAAQYGSDAIAGVLNLTLKNDNHGGNILVNNGIHQSGFGYNTTVSVNKGLKLGPKGFLNLTGEVDYRGYTTSQNYDRDLNVWPVFSSIRAREDSFLRANNKTYQNYRQHNGDARMLNYRAVYNAAVPVSDKVRLYSFGTYNFRRGQAVAPWVLPSANELDLGTRDDFRLGYQPDINTRIHDGSGVLGLEAQLGAWTLDLSQSAALNRMKYDLSNTLNPSLGALSPTAFEAGGLQLTQFVSNATVSRLFDKVLAGTNVALGSEFRTDGYKIIEGDENSWRDYGLDRSFRIENGDTLRPSGGSQGFIGFDPKSTESGNGQRNNVAGFLDVEADVVKRWTVGGAVRFENYSDFGSKFIYKASTRLRVTDWLALRAGYNTGFRAPSQAQQVYSQLTLLPTAGGTTYSGIFNNSSQEAQAAGIGKLRPETSTNISAGLVLTPTKELSLTADVYRIDIDDRISLTNVFTADTAATPANIPKALNTLLNDRGITSAQFFTNAISTRTEGLDLVARLRAPLTRGAVVFNLAANFNRTEQRGDIDVPSLFRPFQDARKPGASFIGQRELSLVTTGSPTSKLIGSVAYEGTKLGISLRATRFGEVSFYDFNFEGYEEGTHLLRFSPKAVFDVLLTYRPTNALLLALGGQNIFNALPDNTITAAKQGASPGGRSYEQYERDFPGLHPNPDGTPGSPSNLPSDRDILPYQMVQQGLNGAFFYLKASYSFGL